MEFINSCYNAETKVAFLTVDTASAVKELDPVAFDMAMDEYFMEDAHVEINGKLYCLGTIEQWVEEQLAALQNETKKGAIA